MSEAEKGALHDRHVRCLCGGAEREIGIDKERLAASDYTAGERSVKRAQYLT